MLKLKKIIGHLDESAYASIVEQLTKTKAENFLFLLTSYRNNGISDDEIIKKLDLNNNSFYVLKSRLFDKIQNNLSSDIDLTKEDVLNQFHQLPDICYSTPREVSVAILLKLEKDLLKFDLHNELVILYSILKRIHLFSDKFFYYSQQYNKHVAFILSIEKSLDILGEFNRKLNLYLFSKSPNLINELLFLYREMDDYSLLNPDRQIEVIKCFLEVQLNLFCHQFKKLDVLNILNRCNNLLQSLPDSSPMKKWIDAQNYLYFEYYLSKNQSIQAEHYYREIEANIKKLLLFTPICTTSHYFLSRIFYLTENNRITELQKSESDSILTDPNDTFSNISLSLYKSLLLFYNSKIKEAISLLNDVINNNSFKDYIHINIEIKLTLVYYYINLKEFSVAENILKNLIRKLKSKEFSNYQNVFDLAKFFNSIISNGELKLKTEKQKDYLTLFIARNKGDYELIKYLIPSITRQFSKN